MRYLFFTLLGFFGPALLMLLLRLMWFHFRYRWLNQTAEPEIIDITPIHKKTPGRLFLISWLLISLACTAVLIWQLDDTPASKHTYIPAHIDAEGNFVPAKTLSPETEDK